MDRMQSDSRPNACFVFFRQINCCLRRIALCPYIYHRDSGIKRAPNYLLLVVLESRELDMRMNIKQFHFSILGKRALCSFALKLFHSSDLLPTPKISKIFSEV